MIVKATWKVTCGNQVEYDEPLAAFQASPTVTVDSTDEPNLKLVLSAIQED